MNRPIGFSISIKLDRGLNLQIRYRKKLKVHVIQWIIQMRTPGTEKVNWVNGHTVVKIQPTTSLERHIFQPSAFVPILIRKASYCSHIIDSCC